MKGGRRDVVMTSGNNISVVQSLRNTQIVIAIVMIVSMGCVLALFYTHAFFHTYPSSTPTTKRFFQSSLQDCEHNKQIKTIKSDAVGSKYVELREQIKELKTKLRLAEQPNAGPFGLVKGLRTNPSVAPDESVNPKLAKTLKRVAVKKELIVVLANSNVKEMLDLQVSSIKKVGIPNYLVVCLDDEIERYCKSNGVSVYKRDPDDQIDAIGKTGGSSAVSGLKFRILREFLQLGYSVLLSDADIIYLQNPFDQLYRDSDIESMTDGHDNNTAYGYADIFDDPTMGWSRYVHTTRIWVYNSGFFYIRPTLPSIEVLDRVTEKLSKEGGWDQAVFNQVLFYPSHPGYEGVHASKRTMDLYSFMNSRVLFKTVRKDPKFKKFKPVVIHINYHPDKLPRMKAVYEFYFNDKWHTLDSFSDGTQI
ncbi:unnamed protein product [Amaranthus hypochondriacus]